MPERSESVDVVVLSSTGIVRALVSAGLSVPHAQAAARLFMPHLKVQERAENRTPETVGPARATGRQIARKRVSAMLSMLDKELDRLCDRAESETQAQTVRRGSGIALLEILRVEHRARKLQTTGVHRLLLSPTMRIVDKDT